MASRLLLLNPYPILKPRNGGQMRAASLMQAACLAGWDVETIAIYPAAFFPRAEWGRLDIVLESAALRAQVHADMLFADLLVARAAANDTNVVRKLSEAIARFSPEVIQIEQPWPWLVLKEALALNGRECRLVYSSQNIEWKARPALFDHGMKTVASEQLLAETRVLEEEVAQAADLTFSISDIEAKEIERGCGRPVVYLPAVSDLTAPSAATRRPRFAAEAREAHCVYAALIGSAYWPNVEGFFDVFPDGLGFLAPGEQIWVAGSLGDAIKRDRRFQEFLSINETRFRDVGYLSESEKADFFAAAECAIAPVHIGAGAKLKTADAIASGRPVVATPHAVEGYGPIIGGALGAGVYVAEAPKAFQRFVRKSLRKGLVGCEPRIRQLLSLTAMSSAWAESVNALASKAPAAKK